MAAGAVELIAERRCGSAVQLTAAASSGGCWSPGTPNLVEAAVAASRTPNDAPIQCKRRLQPLVAASLPWCTSSDGSSRSRDR